MYGAGALQYPPIGENRFSFHSKHNKIATINSCLFTSNEKRINQTPRYSHNFSELGNVDSMIVGYFLF